MCVFERMSSEFALQPLDAWAVWINKEFHMRKWHASNNQLSTQNKEKNIHNHCSHRVVLGPAARDERRRVKADIVKQLDGAHRMAYEWWEEVRYSIFLSLLTNGERKKDIEL